MMPNMFDMGGNSGGNQYSIPNGAPPTFAPGPSPGYESPYGIITGMMNSDTWNALSPATQLAMIRIVTQPQAEDAVGAAQAAYDPRRNPPPPSTPVPSAAPTPMPSPEGTPTSMIQRFLGR